MPSAGPELDFSLPRERCSLHSGQFRQIREKGERLVVGSIVLNWLPNNLGFSRLGIVAPAKIGKSHARSQAKRMLRESFRLNQHQITPSIDLVLVARNSIADKPFGAVQENLLKALDRAKLLRKG